MSDDRIINRVAEILLGHVNAPEGAINDVARLIVEEILSGIGPNSPLGEIAAERRRQIDVEGWSQAHDDHSAGALACAAGCYAIHAGLPDGARVPRGYAPSDWPWHRRWWKPTTPRRDLIKAGALIVAELERLDRVAARGAIGEAP